MIDIPKTLGNLVLLSEITSCTHNAYVISIQPHSHTVSLLPLLLYLNEQEKKEAGRQKER